MSFNISHRFLEKLEEVLVAQYNYRHDDEEGWNRWDPADEWRHADMDALIQDSVEKLFHGG